MATSQIVSNQPEVAKPRFRLSIRFLIGALLVIGLLISGYLSYVKLTDVPMACVATGAFNCNTVQNSVYADFYGIPIAWLGLGMYLLLGGIFVLQNRIPFLIENGTLLFFGVTLFAWVYSMWLVYIQFFVLEALCNWCLMHEVNITIMLGAASVLLWRSWNMDEAADEA